MDLLHSLIRDVVLALLLMYVFYPLTCLLVDEDKHTLSISTLIGSVVFLWLFRLVITVLLELVIG